MDDFTDAERDFQSRNSSDSENDRDSNEIRFRDVSNTIITKAPRERFRLGYFSIIGLVVNRMIGTGIFNTPSTAMRGTQSVGISLLFWFAGAIYTLAGTYMLAEYGLNTPRYEFEGEKLGVPRSGGTLNYLQYVFTWPAYRDRTVYLSGTVFGIVFIILGNMAGNCLIFAIRVLDAANIPREEQSKGAIYGIGIAVATFACFIHAFSRRGGIWMSNAFAVIKVIMLLVIICAGFAAVGGAFEPDAHPENLAASNAFEGAGEDSYGYAQAFLAVIFAYGGFDQPNYVLGEISRPHKKYPRATAAAVVLVCLLYMLVNVVFMMVVPRSEMVKQGSDVALTFFDVTFGSLTPNTKTSQRILSAFMAVSSLGNIIVMTFTAARVKQEIAKEGILPKAKFFGQSKDVSIGRFLKWARTKSFIARPFRRILDLSWMEPSNHSQETPVGALLLHWVFCVILIIVTVGERPTDAYNVLVSLYSYGIQACFGLLLAIGMLYLRFSTRERWKEKAKGFTPSLSILAASLFAVGNLFPITALWVPPNGDYARTTIARIKWYTTPVTCFSVLGLGVLWWVAFMVIAKNIERRHGTVFIVEKVPDLRRDPPGGPPVQIHETVYLNWTAKETLTNDFEPQGTSVHETSVQETSVQETSVRFSEK